MFGLISKSKLRREIGEKLRVLGYKMAMSKNSLKNKYNNKRISEWSYYKKFWLLQGRLSMLEDIIGLLK